MPDDPQPTPTPLPSQFARNVQQQSRLGVLRAALLNANVDARTVDQVVQHQEQQEVQIFDVAGWVAAIGLAPTLPYGPGQPPNTWAVDIVIHGIQPGTNNPTWDTIPEFLFPPNDPKYVPELARAQNFNLRAHIGYALAPGQPALIYSITIEKYPWPS
jgi:hypothetical protein